MDNKRYPTKSALRSTLAKTKISNDYLEAVAEKFGGQTIACNRRTVQMGCFELRNKYGVSEADAAAVAEALCTYNKETGACPITSSSK